VKIDSIEDRIEGEAFLRLLLRHALCFEFGGDGFFIRATCEPKEAAGEGLVLLRYCDPRTLLEGSSETHGDVEILVADDHTGGQSWVPWHPIEPISGEVSPVILRSTREACLAALRAADQEQ
jgi:hypothetical protein